MSSSIDFYYHPTPNPSKVALFLEESGLAYRLIPVDIAKGEQHGDAFRAVNPNGKVPAIIDDGIAIFDSSAILLHLARKTGRFNGDPSDAGQAELLSWLMFIASGVGPFTGQAIHFTHYAPAGEAYGAHRYRFEADRHWAIVEARLATHRYLLGDEYSIVDMALWGWCRGLQYLLGAEAWTRYPNVARLFNEINERPAAQRVAALPSRFDFKQDTDAQTRASLFTHGLPAAATTATA
ncbi:glutathione S-transferase [Roseateles noduli]|nr:glutathione S-transferase [Roseateles noduli]